MAEFDEKAFVATQKKAAAKEKWHRARALEADAEMVRRRAADGADHVVTREMVGPVEEQAEATGKQATALVKAAGIDEATLKLERRETLRNLLTTWRQNLATHRDFLANPDDYGGVDFGGAELVPEEQQNAIYSLEASIAVAEEELEALDAELDNRETRRAKAKAAKKS